MGYTISQVLAPKRIHGVVKRIQASRNTLARLFRFVGPTPSEVPHGGRNFSYDVFNSTREIPHAISPESPTHRSSPQGVRNVDGTFPRLGETIPLLYEEMVNRRHLGGSTNDLDAMGLTYITRQEHFLAEKFLNFIEFQTASMLRGKYYFTSNGETSFTHSWTSGESHVDFEVPSGNLGQLDMLGNGDLIDESWDDFDADIPRMLFAINAAMETLCGLPLEHIAVNSSTWNLVVRNNVVQAQAGTANNLTSIQRDERGGFSAVLASIPWVTWHVMDHVLEVEGASQKVLEDNHIYGFPTPMPSWVALGQGSEVVVEDGGAVKEERFGFYPYSADKDDPAGHDLKAVYNGLPFLYVPSAIVNGEVAFT